MQIIHCKAPALACRPLTTDAHGPVAFSVRNQPRRRTGVGVAGLHVVKALVAGIQVRAQRIARHPADIGGPALLVRSQQAQGRGSIVVLCKIALECPADRRGNRPGAGEGGEHPIARRVVVVKQQRVFPRR